MSKLLFIKLGGGLITDKTMPFSLKERLIGQIASEIKQIIRTYPKLRIIIGNGAGSFGHYTASKHAPKDGGSMSAYGMCETQDSVRQLNVLLVGHFLKKAINAFGANPSSMIVCSDGKPDKVFTHHIKGLLSRGIVPVIYGDIVYDLVAGATILSTEDLFSVLIKELKNDYKETSVIYACTVDGVLDSNGHVIERIAAKDYKAAMRKIYETDGYDVTGGMRTKLEAALSIAKEANGVYILGGNTKGNLLRVLDGKLAGTKITA